MEDEYDEVLVFISFADLDNSDLLNSDEPLLLDGLTSEAPFCRMGDLRFQGQHEYSLGSHLFFQHNDKSGGESALSLVGQSIASVAMSATGVDAPRSPQEVPSAH